ncbi:hypothetical protein VTN02DRAFT_6530 [Thermoascus thermophilus]
MADLYHQRRAASPKLSRGGRRPFSAVSAVSKAGRAGILPVFRGGRWSAGGARPRARRRAFPEFPPAPGPSRSRARGAPDNRSLRARLDTRSPQAEVLPGYGLCLHGAPSFHAFSLRTVSLPTRAHAIPRQYLSFPCSVLTGLDTPTLSTTQQQPRCIPLL